VKERVLKLGRTTHEDFWALRDISLTVEEGETVGILGHNGSGKSTLLKCIAGILKPSSGQVRQKGRIASLLELGAGFHPDLTGRENVYINASFLGIPRKEIEKHFDDIVGFAELEHFIDHQVKFYSSGMYVRLGFAVAINMDPEILLVDEVLAVGDEDFQRKCLDKVHSFQQEGRTIVVVTHSPDMVRQVCDRAAALHHGQMVDIGAPNDVIRTFREKLMTGVTVASDVNKEMATSELSPLWHKVRMTGIEVVYATADAEAIRQGEPLIFRVGYEATEAVDDIVAGIAVYGPQGQLVYGTNTHLLGQDLPVISGRGTISFFIRELPLLDGVYRLTVGLHNLGGLQYDHWEQQALIEVSAPGRDIGVARLDTTVGVDPDATLNAAGHVFRPKS
jgi:ABC-2 type transport system ATP-binding protein